MNYQISLKENLNVLGKIQKTQKISLSIEKEVKKKNIDKGDNESVVTISCKIKFIDSARFLATSLSNLVDSLSEGLRNYKWTDCKSCLEYMLTEDKLLIFCCLKCNKSHKKPFNKCLIKRFANTYEFCGGDISKFCLMLRKAVYPYEYMNAW